VDVVGADGVEGAADAASVLLVRTRDNKVAWYMGPGTRSITLSAKMNTAREGKTYIVARPTRYRHRLRWGHTWLLLPRMWMCTKTRTRHATRHLWPSWTRRSPRGAIRQLLSRVDR
jgi:hypothetical protein